MTHTTPDRRRRGITAVTLAALALTACTTSPSPTASDPDPSASTSTTASASAPSTESGGGEATVPPKGATDTSTLLRGSTLSPEDATTVLDVLPVKEPLDAPDDPDAAAFKPGDDAEAAGWPAASLPGTGCTVTAAVYARDGDNVTTTKPCTITKGTWADPFSETTTTQPGDLFVAPVVPLTEVLRSGGATWTPDQRRLYASAPVSLVATTDKGDAARRERAVTDWMPEAVSGRCAYAVRWISVKSDFGLALTSPAERDALTAALDRCDETDTSTA